MGAAESYRYIFVPGDSRATLLLLHGTGGDESSLLPLARAIDPLASVLALRGNVLENGMPRFFRRFDEGALDLDDLRFRTNDLADFLLGTAERRRLDLKSLVALGYSNGANIAGALLLLRPEVISRAILLRAMLPLRPDKVPDLSGRSVFISAGLHDRIASRQSTLDLEAVLKGAGADVLVNWELAEHGLTRADLEKARSWYSLHH